jgi:pseudaminic acid synthase
MINIGRYKIGLKHKPFIIAEMSGNHNGSLKRALEIVRKAAKCGVSAIKLQTYTPDTMTIKSNTRDFIINSKKSIWHGKNLYQLYKIAHTPWDWHHKIFAEAKKHGLIYFSTPFDETSINFLKKFKVPIFKIASPENTDLRLIKLVAKAGKPMIISLGMAKLNEIRESVKIAKRNGCKKIILLKCTSSYPANEKESNLASIPFLRKEFKCEVGFSDHTLGIGASVAAVSLGATVIEKHFKLDKKSGGVDEKFSLDPTEMKNLVIETNAAWNSIGKEKLGPTKSEKDNLKFRRSIYVIKNIKKGDKITKSNIKCIRPGYGLKTKYFDSILGRIFKKDIKFGTALKWKMFQKL